jgi:co-chaperonin GroES (HSP10)
MKNVFKFVLLLSFVVSAVTWIGCSKDDKKSGGGNSIIGAWEVTDNNGDARKMEFKSGDQVIMYYYTNGVLTSAAKGEFSSTGTELTAEFTTAWFLSRDINGNQFPDADEFVSVTDSYEMKASYIVSGNKLTIKDSDTDEGIVYTRTTSPKPETPTNPPVSPVGTWEETSGDDTMRHEFKNDEYISYRSEGGVIRQANKGTFTYTATTLTMQPTQSWTRVNDENRNGFPDDDEYDVADQDELPPPNTFEYNVSGNSLKIYSEGVLQVTLTRVN